MTLNEEKIDQAVTEEGLDEAKRLLQQLFSL